VDDRLGVDVIGLGMLIGLVAGIGIGLFVAELVHWIVRALARSESEFHGDQFHQGPR